MIKPRGDVIVGIEKVRGVISRDAANCSALATAFRTILCGEDSDTARRGHLASGNVSDSAN